MFGCGRTPTSRTDLAITSTRCGLRRRRWAAGSTTSGRLRSEGLGIPSPHLGCHGGNVDIVSRLLYLAVNCSVSLVSEHTYVDFWEMSPGIISAFYLFASGYTYGVSLRGYGQKFTISTCRWFLGDDFRIVSVLSAQLGSIMDTCTASVYEASGRFLGLSRQCRKPRMRSWTWLLTSAGWFRQCRNCGVLQLVLPLSVSVHGHLSNGNGFSDVMDYMHFWRR